MDNGWISLHRKLLESPIAGNPCALALWVTLLLMANHAPANIINGNCNIEIKRGQLLTSRNTLSTRTGLHVSKIERLLNLFEKMGKIEQQTFSKYRLVSIVNYSTYQDGEQQTNSKRTTSEQQVNTNNKNNKNNKNNNIIRPDDVSQEVWEDFIRQRKSKFTETALKGIEREAAAAGWTLEAALRESATRGWQSFKSEWVTKGKTNERVNKSKSEQLDDILAEHLSRKNAERAGTDIDHDPPVLRSVQHLRARPAIAQDDSPGVRGSSSPISD